MNTKKVTDIGIGLLFFIFFATLGTIFVINFGGLYRFDVNHLNIEGTSGLSYDVIMENYNALIAYCSPFFFGKLEFPSLAASPSGISHFAEVKVIFNGCYILMALSIVLLVVIILQKRKHHDYKYLKTASITSIVFPLLVGLGMSINFNQAFVIFHKLFFRNDDWLFDPATDPIITILPEEYFMHCAVVIVSVVILGSLSLFLAYRIYKRKGVGK